MVFLPPSLGAAPAGALFHWLQTFLCSHEREEMDLESQFGSERVEMGSPWLAFALCRQHSVCSVLDRTGSMTFGIAAF